ncbi:hypothetical protein HMPREF1327_01845 [Enterococcus faecalis 599]|uniref:hypothetical protein n=1 Tax=Enterococcus faecalis TaxID=1351 RepID=UPI00027C85BC|nr:hypothetical protein [Enterococcus faecalis]EJU88779.1 hypothetical protein HMPREF1327_01845 [Enterococcus faecalis 599]WGH71231.1 hypothetical protein OG1RF_000048 [Enterococcus faecalis OG1RF]
MEVKIIQIISKELMYTQYFTIDKILFINEQMKDILELSYYVRNKQREENDQEEQRKYRYRRRNEYNEEVRQK